jgi:hypothetical protein
LSGANLTAARQFPGSNNLLTGWARPADDPILNKENEYRRVLQQPFLAFDTAYEEWVDLKELRTMNYELSLQLFRAIVLHLSMTFFIMLQQQIAAKIIV